MAASSFKPVESEQDETQRVRWAREGLERAARQLPESTLRSAILATLSEREPTVREAIAWIAILQGERGPLG